MKFVSDRSCYSGTTHTNLCFQIFCNTQAIWNWLDNLCDSQPVVMTSQGHKFFCFPPCSAQLQDNFRQSSLSLEIGTGLLLFHPYREDTVVWNPRSFWSRLLTSFRK